MSVRIRHWMHMQPAPQTPGIVFPFSRADAHDKETLGLLMAAAYKNTIDDEGESLDDCIDEIWQTLNGKYGPLLPQASICILHEGKPVAFSIVTLWKQKPLIVYMVTAPPYQRAGRGAFMLRQILSSLKNDSYEDVFLAVTEGNPAEKLYTKIGFKRSEDRQP